jgi:MGT family glycosyltransferase
LHHYLNKNSIMSKVLFLSIPSHGHTNPTLGLAAELINQGENVTFFSSLEFQKSVESIGAEFKCYKSDLNIFQNKNDKSSNEKKEKPGFLNALFEPEKFIDDVLIQIKDAQFDYVIFSAAYPYAGVIAQILNIPTISSYAVFATLKDLFSGKKDVNTEGVLSVMASKLKMLLIKMLPFIYYWRFKKMRKRISKKCKVEVSKNMLNHFMFKGDLNIIYTSKYFIPNIKNYDDSFIFVGPPIYNKKYNVDFPFEKLEGKKVIYISLGTIFSNFSTDLNALFFKTFADTDAVVVMAANNVDVSKYAIPKNFIVRDFVPQLDILKFTSVAITHSGMNSIGDLLFNNVPFVAIPLGADQFYLANRAAELGATIVLDVNNLNAEILKNAVETVQTNPNFLENIKKISQSFVEAGGYKKAVEVIFDLKKSLKY